MQNFWLSWVGRHGSFELNWPWWISGYQYEGTDIESASEYPNICAAIRAESRKAAIDIVYACHDVRPDLIDLRFIEERPDDWTPYRERFPRAAWMPDWPPP